MKTPSIGFLSCMLLSAGFLTARSDAASYFLTAPGKIELVGTSSAVPGGGVPENFPNGTVTVGVSNAYFQLFSTQTNARFVDMRVTLTGVNGTLSTSGGRSGLMIAQTSNSQGLTDTGTMSVLTNFSAVGTNNESSVTLRFNFFAPNTNTAQSVPLEFTSFDLDFNQFMRVLKSDFTLEAHGTALTKTQNATTMSWNDLGNTSSTFNQSSNAVALNNVADSSFQITVGKIGTGYALFMFEFRDPSSNLSSPLTPNAQVPEPSSTLLLISALCALPFLRRR